MQNDSKVLDDIISSQNLIMTSPDLDTIRKKWINLQNNRSRNISKNLCINNQRGQEDLQGRLQRHSSTKKIQISKSTIDRQASGRRIIYKRTSLQNIFNSQVSNYLFVLCYACNNFGHKVVNCRANKRNSNNFESYTQRDYSIKPSDT